MGSTRNRKLSPSGGTTFMGDRGPPISSRTWSVSAFFRDFFDFDEKKLKICDGKIRPTFEILSPGGRAVQTTQNLEEFWKTSWIGVKKELKARYPKHFKPGDPY